MAGAADRILDNRQLRREAAGHAVGLPAPGGDVDKKPVERLHFLLIRRQPPHCLLIVQNTEQVPGGPGLRWAHAQGVLHGVGDLHRPKLVGGQFHLIQLTLPVHDQLPGQSGKHHPGGALLIEVQHHESRGQGGVAAQVDLPAGSEPAQAVRLTLPDGEGGLGKIVLPGDVHHQRLRQPRVQHTDRRLVAVKNRVSKGVNDVLSHVLPSLSVKSGVFLCPIIEQFPAEKQPIS